LRGAFRLIWDKKGNYETQRDQTERFGDKPGGKIADEVFLYRLETFISHLRIDQVGKSLWKKNPPVIVPGISKRGGY